MEHLKKVDQKKHELKKAQMLVRVLELKDKLTDAFLKADKYEIEHINDEFLNIKKEFEQYVSK